MSVSTQQTGLMPPWPRGRLIADIAGFFAKIGLALPPFTYLVGWLFPGLDPSDPHLGATLLTMTWAAAIGTIWLTLRQDMLNRALAATAINFALIAGAILFVAIRNMRSGASIGALEGFVLYGVGSLALAGLWLAHREIRAERARRTTADD